MFGRMGGFNVYGQGRERTSVINSVLAHAGKKRMIGSLEGVFYNYSNSGWVRTRLVYKMGIHMILILDGCLFQYAHI